MSASILSLVWLPSMSHRFWGMILWCSVLTIRVVQSFVKPFKDPDYRVVLSVKHDGGMARTQRFWRQGSEYVVFGSGGLILWKLVSFAWGPDANQDPSMSEDELLDTCIDCLRVCVMISFVFVAIKRRYHTSKGGKVYWQALQQAGIKTYYPNVYRKSACRPPCAGLDCRNPCPEDQHDDRPTWLSCWASSYWWHLRKTQQVYGPSARMLQILEPNEAGIFQLGIGQTIELAMAEQLGIQVVQVGWTPDIEKTEQALEQLEHHAPALDLVRSLRSSSRACRLFTLLCPVLRSCPVFTSSSWHLGQ